MDQEMQMTGRGTASTAAWSEQQRDKQKETRNPRDGKRFLLTHSAAWLLSLACLLACLGPMLLTSFRPPSVVAAVCVSMCITSFPLLMSSLTVVVLVHPLFHTRLGLSPASCFLPALSLDYWRTTLNEEKHTRASFLSSHARACSFPSLHPLNQR